MPKITPWQIQFPKEAQLVGAILAGYGELEFELFQCVSSGMNDLNTAFRAMFRMRNESQRIDLADALVAPAIAKHGLSAEYAHAIGSIRCCRTIRNNFAHCHWRYIEDPLLLQYCNLEDAAKTKHGEPIIKFETASAELLAEQVSYFGYCSGWLQHIHHEIDRREGRIDSHIWLKPTARPQPMIHSRDS